MNERQTNLKPSSLPNPPAPSPYAIRMPGQFLYPKGYVFLQLERVIHRHLYRNCIPSLMESADRYLLIAGETGSAKTATSCDAALRFGWAVAILPAAELASEHEGGATTVLTGFFAAVVASSAATRLRHMAIIDDMELSILGADDKMGRTINSPLLTGEFQRLADRPKAYRNYDGSIIPVIFTGNDFSRIRSSLLRNCRTMSYVHKLSLQDKVEFAFHQLRPRTREDLQLTEKLVRTYRREPITFWAALASDLKASQLDRLIDQGITDPAKAEGVLSQHRPIEPDVVWKLAKARAQRTQRSFL